MLSVKVDWGYAMSRTASVDPEVARVHAVGFLLKDTPGNWPPPYDRRGGPGHAVPIVIKRLITSFVGKTPSRTEPARNQLASPTAREEDVVRTLARGLPNAEIGRKLKLTEATVRAHVSRLPAKPGQ